MKTNILLPIRLAAGLAVAALPIAALAQTPTRADTNTSMTLKHADRSFIEKAAKDGSDEVEISRIAVERSSNPQVREFAQMMVADHSGANESLISLASTKGLTLPAKESKEAAKWSKKDAKDFDKDYMSKMVSD